VIFYLLTANIRGAVIQKTPVFLGITNGLLLTIRKGLSRYLGLHTPRKANTTKSLVVQEGDIVFYLSLKANNLFTIIIQDNSNSQIWNGLWKILKPSLSTHEMACITKLRIAQTKKAP